MLVRRLGRSGLKVSALSLGSWTTYGGSVDQADATRIVRHAFELGIHTFDTADVYIRGRGRARARPGARRPAARAGRHRHQVHGPRVGRPARRGPLAQAHLRRAATRACAGSASTTSTSTSSTRPDKDAPIEETLRAFEDLVRCGQGALRRATRTSTTTRRSTARCSSCSRSAAGTCMVSSQPRWNLVDRHVEQAHVPLCRKWGVGHARLLAARAGRADEQVRRRRDARGQPRDVEVRALPRPRRRRSRPRTWRPPSASPRGARKRARARRRRSRSPGCCGTPRCRARSSARPAIEQIDENVKACELELSAAQWREVEAAIAGPGKGRAKAAKPAASAAKATARRSPTARGGRAAGPRRP